MDNNLFLVSEIKNISNKLYDERKDIDSNLIFKIKDSWKDAECNAFLREVEKVSDDLNFITLLLGELEYYINRKKI